MSCYHVSNLSSYYYIRNATDAVLLNIDGYRRGGPAGPARIQNPNQPDSYVLLA